jgi:hypothetical protein
MDNRLEMHDALLIELDAARPTDDDIGVVGEVTVEVHDSDGNLKHRCVTKNLVTAVGDQLYASRGAGLTTSATPTGMKLGTGSTAPAKTGAGAALVTYLAGSNKAFDATFPTAAGGIATYKRTYAPGEATTASPITEVVIVNDTIATDATSAAAATISRALIAGVASKAAGDTLTVTWTHTLAGT